MRLVDVRGGVTARGRVVCSGGVSAAGSAASRCVCLLGRWGSAVCSISFRQAVVGGLGVWCVVCEVAVGQQGTAERAALEQLAGIRHGKGDPIAASPPASSVSSLRPRCFHNCLPTRPAAHRATQPVPVTSVVVISSGGELRSHSIEPGLATK